TLDGVLGVEGGSFGRSTVFFNGEQTVSGTGAFVLGGSDVSVGYQSHVFRFFGEQSGVEEVLTFGPDVTLRGTGFGYASQTGDHLRFLGDVIADGGRLSLLDVDNGGEMLSLSEVNGGELVLRRGLSNAVVDIAAGSAVDISGDVTSVSLTGAGTAHLSSVSRIDGLTVGAGSAASIDVAGGGGYGYSSRSATIDADLTVDGTFEIAGGASRTAAVIFSGSQQVDGSGEILLSRANALDAGIVNNSLRFDGVSTNAETLVFGEDLTIRGDGRFYATGANDRLQVLGTLAGIEGGALRLDDIDNAGESFAVDASAGVVAVQGRIEDAVIEAAAGQTGRLEVVSGTLEGVTLGIDTALDASGARKTLTIEQGLTLNNADLSLEGSQSRIATLRFADEQTVDGSGEILLSRANALEGGAVNNRIDFEGASNAAEVLTFGAGVTIRGDGRLYASDSNDRIQVLGTLAGIDGGILRLDDINNAGESFAVDVSSGSVALDGWIEDAVIEAAAGQTGRLEIVSGLFENVTLGIDTVLDAATTNRTLSIDEGLTLDADFILAGSVNRSAR
ncbi:hypothetical protein, partial [Denitrobaculum tricleocarpae]|uniref:hypothetical protein n=1 Tax=Denitrobaculum tricleocarpae TaxID=2591009 RepID=UPI0015D39D15